MAPFKSESQRRLFHAMAERGEISKKKVAEYEEKTHGDLPERVKKKEVRKEAKVKAEKFQKKRGKAPRG